MRAIIDAYRAAAQQAADWSPGVLIVTSPRTVMYGDCFRISPAKQLRVICRSSARRRHGCRSAKPWSCETKSSVRTKPPVSSQELYPALDHSTFLQLLIMAAGLCDRAAKCGLRSFRIMAGAFDGLAVRPRLLSYEGVFGVGVAAFEVIGTDENCRFAQKYEQFERSRSVFVETATRNSFSAAGFSLGTTHKLLL